MNDNLKPQVFLSGGFKSNWQAKVIEKCENNFTLYNPRTHGLPDSRKYTAWDIHHIKKSDIVFAYMENSNPSGYGLTFEVGMAYALNKTIILVDEKSPNDDWFKKYFELVRISSNIILGNLDEGIEYLNSFRIK
jgi:nucleoside 2-deoxyribosyltransferase